MTDRERRVREVAYSIWESEGRPEGQEERHWALADTIVDAQDARAAEISGDIPAQSST
jgi:hypothetical protein